MRTTLSYMNFPVPFPNKLHRIADKSLAAVGLYFLILELCYLQETSTITRQSLLEELDTEEEEVTTLLSILSKKGMLKIQDENITCEEAKDRLDEILSRRKSASTRQRAHRGKRVDPDTPVGELDLSSIDVPDDEICPPQEDYRLSDSDYKKLIRYIRLWNERFHTDAQKAKKDVLERTVIKIFKEKKIPVANVATAISFMESSTEKIRKTNIADWASDGLFCLSRDELSKYFFKDKKTGGLTPYSETGNPPVIPINQRLKKETEGP
jgi:hypothetical protein